MLPFGVFLCAFSASLLWQRLSVAGHIVENGARSASSWVSMFDGGGMAGTASNAGLRLSDLFKGHPTTVRFPNDH
jgi:hypothetical protein